MSWPTRPRTGATPQTSGMPAPAPVTTGGTTARSQRTDLARYVGPQIDYRAQQAQRDANGANAHREDLARFHREREADEARARAGGQRSIKYRDQPMTGGTPRTPAPAPQPAPPAPMTVPLSSLTMGDPSRTREYADRGQQPLPPRPIAWPQSPPVPPATMGQPIDPRAAQLAALQAMWGQR